MDNFYQDIINEFWDWVCKHCDGETVVDYDGNKELCIWVDIDDLEDFTERYIPDSENRLQVTLFSDCVCIEVNKIIGGYSGFNMDDVWKSKPKELN